MQLLDFDNRTDLVRGYNQVLQGNYEEFKEEGKSIYNNGWLKTRLIEFYNVRQNQDIGHDMLLQEIRRSLQSDSLQIDSTKDEKLFKVTYKNEEVIYLDCLDSRFWIAYSISKNTIFTEMFNCFFTVPEIDKLWLPGEFLDGYTKIGKFKGYGGNFDNEFFLKEDFEEDDIFKLSFKSWGNTETLLKLIQESEELRSKFSMTNIRIRTTNREHSEEFILDDITFNGKITSTGFSFAEHKKILDKTIGAYRGIIVDTIENKLAFQLQNNSLKGEGIHINIPSPNTITDPSAFARKLFSGRRPFLLWGIGMDENKYFTRVNAIDLHVNQNVMFDIYKDRIIIYLSEDTCGNTVARFYTLLQQNFSSLLSIESSEETEIFKLNG